MSRGGRAVRALAALALPWAAGACNLWPGGLDDGLAIPYEAIAEGPIVQRSLEIESLAEPQTVDEGLEQIRSREPDPAETAPRAVREVGDALVTMSVAELRLLVLQNNLDLEVALFDPAIARARVGAEEGRFDALIGSRFAYRDRETPRIDGPLVDFTSADPALDGAVAKLTELEQRREQLDLGLGITVPLPTGGSISLDGALNEKTVTDPQRFEQYLAATRLSFSQPLLRNAGRDASMASIRLARVDERAARVRTKLAAMRVLARAEKAFWRLYAARRLLDVRTEQYRLATENLELVQRRVDEGVTPRVEIARAEVGVYSRLEALIVAETEWRLRQRALKTYLASDDFPLRGGRMIDTATEPLLAGIELDRDVLVERALAERLDLIELELGIVRDGVRIAYQENQVLPIANLDFQYGLLARDDSLGQAFTRQGDFDDPDLWVGLTFEVPLTNQRRRAQLDEAPWTRAQRLASVRARELMVRSEVLDAADVIERNWQRIVAARQNVIVAGVNYDAERRQFEQGMRTMREVLEALTDVGEAQAREIRAIVEYQAAQIDLAFATGTLLGYARVELAPLGLPAAADERGGS